MGYRGGGYMNVTDKEKLLIVQRNTSRCLYCNQYADLQIEHIIPLSKGGKHQLINITLACSMCNRHKWDFMLDVFLERIINKRDKVLNEFYSFSGRCRSAIRRGNNDLNYVSGLYKKIALCRKEHSYFTAIINSILYERYKIF